jgi:hypothetical protein
MFHTVYCATDDMFFRPFKLLLSLGSLEKEKSNDYLRSIYLYVSTAVLRLKIQPLIIDYLGMESIMYHQ